jgi:hypothetical protein
MAINLRIGMGGHRIEVIVELFAVLPMITLSVAEPEHALLEDGLIAVHQPP